MDGLGWSIWGASMRISGNKTNVGSSFRVARYAYCHFGRPELPLGLFGRPGNSRHSPENIFLSGNSSLASRIGLLINCRWCVFVLHFRGPFVTNPIIPNRRKSLRPLNFNHSLTPSWHNLHSRIMALGNCLAIKFGGFSATCRRSLGGKFKWRLLTLQEISTLLRCYGSVI